MVIPLTILVRTSASEPPEERTIGLNPDAVARIEEGIDEGTIHLWADGTDRPYVIRGTVEEHIAYVNGWFEEEEAEECEPVNTEIA